MASKEIILRESINDALMFRGTALKCVKLGIGSHRVLFPHGADANDYGRTGGSLAVFPHGAEWQSKSEAAPGPSFL